MEAAHSWHPVISIPVEAANFAGPFTEITTVLIPANITNRRQAYLWQMPERYRHKYLPRHTGIHTHTRSMMRIFIYSRNEQHFIHKDWQIYKLQPGSSCCLFFILAT